MKLFHIYPVNMEQQKKNNQKMPIAIKVFNGKKNLF